MALLTGFMLGSMRKIWPWKEVLQFRTNHHGEKVPFIEKSILPSQYIEDPQIVYAILFMIIGFICVFLLERFSLTKKIKWQ